MVSVIDKPGRPKRRTTPFPKYEVVERTFLQEKYNSERWAAMVSEPVRKVRPFWLFDSILDDRTTQICKLCNGVLLPWDHVWWQTHKPPLHWGCRSIIRAVSRRTADRRGITELMPSVHVAPPFGTPPGKSGLVLDKSRFDRALIEKAEKKVQNPRAVDPNREALKRMSFYVKNITIGQIDKEMAAGALPVDAVHVERMLKEQGADILFANNKLEQLTINAIPTVGRDDLLSETEIPFGNEGLFSEPSMHRGGKGYIKVSNGAVNPTPKRLVEILGNRKFNGREPLNPIGFGHIVQWPGHREFDQVFSHEFGHAVHMQGGLLKDVDGLIRSRFDADDREAISNYANTDYAEYFAESYSAYRGRREELKRVAPKAFAMVQDVLSLRGLPL